MTTSSEPLPIDRALDDIVIDMLRDHRIVQRVPGAVVCACGQSFDRRHGRSASHRHHRHVAWAISWALREGGYGYVGDA